MKKTHHSTRVHAMLLAAAASVAVGASASAAEYTWQPTGSGNHHWPTTSQDNWGTGVGGAFPGSTGAPSGDTANLTSNITANQGVHLHQPINIEALNIGDPNGSHYFAISSGTGTQTLTLESLTPGAYALGTADGTPPAWPNPPDTDAERRLAAAMQAYWASFARSGTPTAADAPDWPAYGEARAYMGFDGTPRPGEHLMPGMFELVETVVCRRRAHGGLPWHWNVGIISPPLPEGVAGCP